MPRIRSTNPIEARMQQLAAQGGVYQNQIQELIKSYNQKFGLDKPLWEQYLIYWRDLLHLDLGVSLAFYPQTAFDMIARSAPWTIGLLIVSTLIAFVLGTLFGALMAWPRTSRIALWLIAALYDAVGHSVLPAGHAVHLCCGDALASCCLSAGRTRPV